MPRSQRPRKRHNRLKTLIAPTDKRPHPFHAWRTFEPVYKLLDTLKSGEIDAVQGKPVMADWDSELMEVAPALDGWISCWDRICTGESIRMDLSPLRQMQRYAIGQGSAACGASPAPTGCASSGTNNERTDK